MHMLKILNFIQHDMFNYSRAPFQQNDWINEFIKILINGKIKLNSKNQSAIIRNLII